jgi:hypothetical protein
MNEYNEPSPTSRPEELRETANLDLELPIPTEPLKSWNGTVDPAAALEFSETQLARFWSNPEFVRRRAANRVNVPFEL